MNATQLKLSLELIWWVVTLFIAFIVLFPISKAFHTYPFWWLNLIFIIVFITWSRYLFLLKHTFMARMMWLKVLLIVFSIPLVFYLIGGVHEFQVFLDEQGPEVLFSKDYVKESLSGPREMRLWTFIRRETLFFGVGSVIVAVLFPFRMLMSIWRQMNRGTV